MLYAEQTAAGKQSRRLSGDYTTAEAAEKLLADSGLVHSVAENGTVTVKPVPQNTGTVILKPMTVFGEGGNPSLTTPSIKDSREKLNQVPGGTTLLDGERIREKTSYDVSDTLSYVPGLYASTGTSGFIGGGARISMRGSDVNSAISPILGVKVLRDGMPITNANGATDTESINLYAINQVEVYRGANAMQYGAAQLGGAINIISPTGHTANGLRLGMTGGSYGFINPTISAGHVFKNGFDVYGSFAYAASDNFRKNADEQHIYGYGNIGYRWNEKNETRLHIDIQDHDYLLPDVLTKKQLEQDPKQNSKPSTPRSGFPAYRFALQHTTHLTDDNRLDVGSYYYQKDFCFSCNDYNHNHDEWKEVGFNLRHEFQHRLFGLKNKFSYGGLWQRMWVEDVKTSRQEDEDYFNQELFAENKLSLNDHFTFVLGLQSVFRNNENHRTFGPLKFGAVDYTATGGRASKDTYGFNPKAGLIWAPTGDVQFYGNVSRSWDQPRIRQLQNYAQTPTLKEQTATTLEIGTRGKIDYLNWDLSVYHAWVDDEILVVESPPLSQNFITANANKALHTGVELGLESTLPLSLVSQNDAVRLRGTYTWNNFRFDKDISFGNKQLPGIPEHVGRMELLYQHPSGFSVGPNVQAASSNWVDFANTLSADSYALLGARIAYDTKHYRVYVEGRNLTDKHYASSVAVMANAGGTDQAQFYPGSTASVFSGIELRW
ncbi:MAG: TonB-dependent receptor domain-containing protein [Methylobacter sp.]